MRCKKHLSDHSSSVGVCATCLRDRLFSLIHSQSLAERQPGPISNPNLNPDPPPLVFPRSVSPYRSGRPIQIHQFYSTPLVDPTQQRRKKQSGKFGLISKLFRSRSDKSEPSDHAGPTTSTSLSSYCSYAKGMSPERRWDELESPARSFPRPSPGRVRPSPSRSGIAFCLSPLVRPSPARQWSFPGDCGEARVSTAGKRGSSNKPHLSNAASFCANRSRKLADFGRLNRNR